MDYVNNRVTLNKPTIEAPKQDERFVADGDNTVKLTHVIRGKGFKGDEKGTQYYETQREVNCLLDFEGVTREELITVAASKVYYDMKPDETVDDVVSVRDWLDRETVRTGGKRGPVLTAKKIEALKAKGMTAEDILASILGGEQS